MEEYTVSTWFEQDRAMVAVEKTCPDTGEDLTIVEWWDETVYELVEAGFLNPKDWEGSAIEYAAHIGFIEL